MHPPIPAQTRTAGLARLPGKLRVLLVEDDDADAFLVEELLAETAAQVELTVVTRLADARVYYNSVDCVLLDLGLPDAQGIEGLRKVLAEVGAVAVCVLTGRQDAHLGITAVAEGAQDYLVKGQVDGALLARSLQYAVERKNADEAARRLREAELRAAESARLERGLLPQPLMTGDEIQVHTFYRPGREQALLGGDFFDVVQTGPDRIHALIGDVSGHDVEQAALGVELRVAWRALVLGGVPEPQVLSALEDVLASERSQPSTFATVGTVDLDLAASKALFRLAGHPPPLLLTDGQVSTVDVPYGLLLGMGKVDRAGHEVELGSPDWSLVLYTDGVIEGRRASEVFGMEGLCRLCQKHRDLPLDQLPDRLVAGAEEFNGGPLADDVAMLVLSRGRGR